MTATTLAPPTITQAMYVDALEILGLDPDLVVSINLTSTWITLTLVEADEEGRPHLSLGQLRTKQVTIHLPIPAPESEPESEDEAEAEAEDEADESVEETP